MLTLRDPADAAVLKWPELRQLVLQRFEQLTMGGMYSPSETGYFVVVEPFDPIEAIEAALPLKMLTSAFGDAKFGEADFAPSFEWMVERPGSYECVFILSDDGYGIDVLIPKLANIDGDLLRLCASYAEPFAELLALQTVGKNIQ